MSTPIRLLLVEDSDDDALLLVRELTRAGYDPSWTRVHSAATLEAALGTGDWDLIISDFSLPGFTGLDALHLVRACTQETPFIFVSGTIGEDVAVDAMRAGAQDYVTKGNLARLGSAIARELRDVAERKRAAAVLRAAQDHAGSLEARLRHVLESIPDVLYSVDPALTVCHYMSPACFTAFGYRPEQFLSNPRLWGERVLEEDRAAVRARRERVLQLRRAERLEYRVRHQDGTIRWLEDEIVPVMDAGGAVERLDGVARDITERHRLEIRLVQTTKMEAVGRLAGGIAHDFNNILTAVLAHSEFLAEAMSAGDPRKDDVEEIRRCASRAAALTQQLLAFSRKQVLQPKVIALNEVVRGVEKLLRRLIGEDIALKVRLAPDLWTIQADPGQLEQVLVNLAVNARDAMPTGGALTIETANSGPPLSETAEQSAPGPTEYVVLTVLDTGVGMDPETKAHIFEPFFTTKDVGQGTGMGLATVYGIVKQSGGLITVDSTCGKGATFRIYFPRASKPPTIEAVVATSEVEGGSETVLVVEDQREVRNVVCRTLEGAGYRVIPAVNADDARRLVQHQTERVNLVLTDVVMPGGSGPELVAWLQVQHPGIRVLYMSGYTDTAVGAQELRSGGLSLLQKPFDRMTLTKRVREALDKE